MIFCDISNPISGLWTTLMKCHKVELTERSWTEWVDTPTTMRAFWCHPCLHPPYRTWGGKEGDEEKWVWWLTMWQEYKRIHLWPVLRSTEKGRLQFLRPILGKRNSDNIQIVVIYIKTLEKFAYIYILIFLFSTLVLLVMQIKRVWEKGTVKILRQDVLHSRFP